MRLINCDFTLLWAGQSVSQTGDYVFDTTLTLWVGTVLHGFHGQVAGLHVGGYDTVLTGSALLVVAGGVYAVLGLRERVGRAPAVPVLEAG
ncbi:hypothetical protein [Kitasatospora sp. GAS1066B]|uniref:hypothetical protein n=1 Tax=Kitasatospora sp. GAS1066B TaxID=3156271 RepID=UPI003517AEC6